MQSKHQKSHKLTKLILTTYLCCLPLIACNNQQQVSQENQTTPTAEAQTTSTPAPLLETSLPQDDNYFLDNQIWGENGDKENLLTAIDNSLSYLQTPRAEADY
ncbi:MAG: murein transglycosylase, partial [Cyanobacteria bacterium J06628_3]